MSLNHTNISSLCYVTMSTMRNYEMYSCVKILKTKVKVNVRGLLRGLLKCAMCQVIKGLIKEAAYSGI